MSRKNPLTHDEEKALRTAVLLGRSGAGFTAKQKDIPACESLVRRDYLEHVQGEDRGYVLTKAVAVTAAQQAEQAQLN